MTWARKEADELFCHLHIKEDADYHEMVRRIEEALLSAHAAGREEGIEQSAKVVEEYDGSGNVIDQIRALSAIREGEGK